ncbi:Maf family protein [Fimbriimonas ginsengisoli]|uniref:dTTP/UTP pyrophosphatase n=1 Tax=Fimbriimonas ginsengisoli Gsoil 348 TaxID=661478 RepID=A0A068NR34_FIMGI|nr:Maf family protein [Fimbriimonas ginsengisoli]AIE85215.1 Septum formation protein Maf [Fimbriimonas ginsengisoli Gsoil 348]
MNLPYPVVLASGSPRRRELLSQLVKEFEVVVSDVDESVLPEESAGDLAERLAGEKARAVSLLRPGALVIGGDTVVTLPGPERQILNKPNDVEEAVDMLRRLSGRAHQVITGVSVVWAYGAVAFQATTEVEFRKLTDEEIHAYVATGEPMDKAGAYAIQGGAGRFVQAVEGSMSNVIGLPIEALEDVLRNVFGAGE